MKPLDPGAFAPRDHVEPRCISIAATAHLLGVRKRQVWEWIIEGSLHTVMRDERMVVCVSIEELIRDAGAKLETILRSAEARFEANRNSHNNPKD